MRAIEPPATRAVIWVCNRCGKRMKGDHEKNPSRQLVSRLKKDSRARFGRDAVRAALTSCLSLCPKNRLSVAIVPTAAGAGAPHFFLVGAEDIERTSEKLLQQFDAVGESLKR